VITISADDAGDDFGGGTAFAFEMQGRRCTARAQNLIGLMIESNSVAVSPDASQLKNFNLAAPKSKKIELCLMPGKIDRDRFG
jgi:hypothetical protein